MNILSLSGIAISVCTFNLNLTKEAFQFKEDISIIVETFCIGQKHDQSNQSSYGQ